MFHTKTNSPVTTTTIQLHLCCLFLQNTKNIKYPVTFKSHLSDFLDCRIEHGRIYYTKQHNQQIIASSHTHAYMIMVTVKGTGL